MGEGGPRLSHAGCAGLRHSRGAYERPIKGETDEYPERVLPMSLGCHTVRVKVQTGDFWCEGEMAVPTPRGYKGRVLDLLNGSSEFLALTDVDLYEKNEEMENEPVLCDVLILRKGEIQYVIPLDD
jgi:hypothetical protein